MTTCRFILDDGDGMHNGTCPRCNEYKFIGHGPLCHACYMTTADDTSDLDAARDDFEHDIAMNDPIDFERGN